MDEEAIALLRDIENRLAAVEALLRRSNTEQVGDMGRRFHPGHAGRMTPERPDPATTD